MGVIIFGHGANPSIGCPYGLTIYQCSELTRIALNKGHRTEVSRIVKIALKYLKEANPGLRLVVSYADQGQGHHGGVYQAGGWIYDGVSKGVPQLWYNGKAWHAKALKTSFPELKLAGVRKLPATDKHKYLMPLDDEMRKQIEPLAKPYPKRPTKANSADQVESGGAIPTRTLQILEGDDA
jgi:hypothetical protein